MFYYDFFPTIRAQLQVEKTKKLYRSILKNLPPEIKNQTDIEKETGQPAHIIEKVYLKDGALTTDIVGHEYPVRFYTPTNIVDLVDIYKKIISLSIKNGLGGITFLYLNRKAISEWMQHVSMEQRLLLKDENWSQVVREIRRVLKGRIDDNFLDTLSLILQTDMAYCYRAQDIFGELDKEEFLKNPTKEIKRLMEIFTERDTGANNVRSAITKLLPFLWLLRFFPKIIKTLKEIVREIDLNEVKFDECDRYWVAINKSYKWGFLNSVEK